MCFGPNGNFFSGLQQGEDGLKTFTPNRKSKTLTLTCSLIWACSEVVNLQNGQNKTSQIHVQHSLVPVICTGLPHHFLLSTLPVWHEVAWFRIFHTKNRSPVSCLCVQIPYAWITVSSPS